MSFRYSSGELVPLNVNRLTSAAPGLSNFPIDYYDSGLHFCKPNAGVRDVSESLGSILFGDRIQNSPYELRMGRNETCKAACDAIVIDNGGEPGSFTDADYINLLIEEQYQIFWLIDGLPVAQPYEVGLTGEVLYLVSALMVVRAESDMESMNRFSSPHANHLFYES